MEAPSQQLEKIGTQVHETNVNVAALTTLVRQHIQEQRGLNSRAERMLIDGESRIRALEQWRAQVETRLPPKLLAADQIEERFALVDRHVNRNNDTVTSTVAALDEKVEDLGKKHAKLMGGIGVVVVAAQFFLKWIFG